MAENAVALNGLNAESRAHFSRFVLPILMYRLANPKPTLAISGIVTVSGERFCHVIAHKGFLFPKEAHKFRYEVVFPNGATIRLDNIVIEKRGQLASFYCPIETGIVDAVPFANDHITRNQKLKMYLYEINNASQLVNDVTNGYVTHVGEDYFAYDCSPSKVSRNGSPVFNEDWELVGLSKTFDGVTKAFDVDCITTLLSRFYEGMNDKPLPEILQRIQVVGEERFS
ncbi:hypothetical protein ACQ4PT_058343 [Festuca glaucescens]